MIKLCRTLYFIPGIFCSCAGELLNMVDYKNFELIEVPLISEDINQDYIEHTKFFKLQDFMCKVVVFK